MFNLQNELLQYLVLSSRGLSHCCMQYAHYPLFNRMRSAFSRPLVFQALGGCSLLFLSTTVLILKFDWRNLLDTLFSSEKPPRLVSMQMCAYN